jgi:hypothetical protein
LINRAIYGSIFLFNSAVVKNVRINKDYIIQSKIVYLDTPKELVNQRREENLTNQLRHDVEPAKHCSDTKCRITSIL